MIWIARVGRRVHFPPSTRFRPVHHRPRGCLTCEQTRHQSSSKDTITNQNHDTKDRSISRNGSGGSGSSVRIGVAAGVALVGSALAGRVWYDQVTRESDDLRRHKGAPRQDKSAATVLLKREIPTSETSASHNRSMAKFQKVNSQELQAFVSVQSSFLNQARERGQEIAKETLRSELKAALGECAERVPLFSDWYFAYSTNWKLLSLALSSATKHAITIRKEQTLNQKVSHDLQEHVCRKYEATVLRPAQTDPKIHRAVVKSLAVAHQHYLDTLLRLEHSFDDFLQEQSRLHKPYGKPPTPNEVVLCMDWIAQFQKVEHVPMAYEKTPTVALIGTGAIIGKVAGGAAAKAVFSKLAAPFASKAVGVTLSGSAAAGAGAMAAGPFGAAVGAAVGVGVDMGVNAGVALMQRPVLEEEVHHSLEAMQVEWEDRLLPEVERVQAVWFDHAESLITTGTTTTKSK